MTRPRGNFSSADVMPALTRCRASSHARSGRPTITKAGVPSLTCASTSTRRGSRPTRAWVTARASTLRRYAEKRHESSSELAHDEHVFEVLAGATAGAAVHVAAQPLVEPQARALENRRIEIAAVVDDDRERRVRRERGGGVRKRARDALAVRVDRSARRAGLGGAELELARSRRARAARTRSGAARGSRSGPDTAAT